METAIEIERVFYQDVSEKKKAGSGSFHRRGKGIKHGMSGIKFPYDFMTAKQKRQLNGAVIMTNIFTSLMDFKELQTHPEDRQKVIIEKWRETYKTKEIQEALGIDPNAYYNLLYDLEILERPVSSKGSKGDENKKKKHIATAEDIIKYQDLKMMPKEKQLEILDDYNEHYNLPSIANIWGKDVKSIYSLRYSLRKSLEKANNKQTNEKAKVEKDKQLDLGKEMDSRKKVSSEGNGLEEPKDKVLDNTQKELKELKVIVEQQAQLLHSLIDAKKAHDSVAAFDEQIQESVAAFTMKFEKETEGFILHQDLKRFITVLEKNPDKFNVKIEITRIEE